MGSRDRPSREAKKKPKDKGAPEAAAAVGAAAERRADPQAAQAASREPRTSGRELIDRADARRAVPSTDDDRSVRR